MEEAITAADEISRCIIYDRAFDHDLHVDEMLWRFGQSQEDGASHESAVLRRFAPDAADVHRIGCGIAATQNERKGQPDPGKNRRYYCGFRSASFSSLPSSGDGWEVILKQKTEGGEKAHVDVALTVHGDTKGVRANQRTDAGLALAEPFGPPAKHRCECDLNDNMHPFDVFGEDCLTRGLEGRWSSLSIDEVIIGTAAGSEEDLFGSLDELRADVTPTED